MLQLELGFFSEGCEICFWKTFSSSWVTPLSLFSERMLWCYLTIRLFFVEIWRTFSISETSIATWNTFLLIYF